MVAGDRNSDGRLSREEFTGLADTWYDKFDSGKTGSVARADFPQRFASLPPAWMPAQRGSGGGNGQAPATNLGPDTEVGTWPEFNTMIGGFFKFHWNDGQSITVKIDEPKHPLNAAFKGQGFVIVDETYTFARDTYSRQNLKVLTSIDYAKMSAEDKAKEQNPRPDGDYALSWIRREGQGPRLLRSPRAQRKDLRDQADARAHHCRHAVRARRSARPTTPPARRGKVDGSRRRISDTIPAPLGDEYRSPRAAGVRAENTMAEDSPALGPTKRCCAGDARRYWTS